MLDTFECRERSKTRICISIGGQARSLQSSNNYSDQDTRLEGGKQCITKEHTEGGGERNQDEFRQKDVARKRAAYWNAIQLSRQSGLQAKSLPSIVDDIFSDEVLNSNRIKRSIVKAIAEAVKHILQTLEHFNDAAKKEFFERIWLQQSVKQFQPSRFGCAKVDASVSATLDDLQQSMKIVKTARRKDHLANKQAVLTALVGQSIVGKRYQSSLAKALGIKCLNMPKAAKRQEDIDTHQSIRYPMGERKVRCDRIATKVVEVVQKYWEGNTRIFFVPKTTHN